MDELDWQWVSIESSRRSVLTMLPKWWIAFPAASKITIDNVHLFILCIIIWWNLFETSKPVTIKLRKLHLQSRYHDWILTLVKFSPTNEFRLSSLIFRRSCSSVDDAQSLFRALRLELSALATAYTQLHYLFSVVLSLSYTLPSNLFPLRLVCSKLLIRICRKFGACFCVTDITTVSLTCKVMISQ